MKYLLFAGENYYPSGGASDFIAAFDSVDDAKAHAEQQQYKHDWAHIASFDGQTLQEVAEWQMLSRYSAGAWRDV